MITTPVRDVAARDVGHFGQSPGRGLGRRPALCLTLRPEASWTVTRPSESNPTQFRIAARRLTEPTREVARLTLLAAG